MARVTGGGPPESVLAAAHEEARAAGEAGAHAVVLTGSYAMGGPLPYADIDLVVVGKGPRYRLSRRHEYLVATSWRTAEQVRDSFAEPGEVGTVIPGWRAALVLHDPRGVAAELRNEAQAWTWDEVAAACDRHVVDEAWGYAEEVHKLVGALEAGMATTAAVQRSIIALRLPGLMAIQRRMLYGSENRLWAMVAEQEGEPWAGAQARALGTAACPFEDGCLAALQLYLLYVEAVNTLVDDAIQRDVIDGACALARSAVGRGRRR